MKKILCFFFAIFLIFTCIPSVPVQAGRVECEACMSDSKNVDIKLKTSGRSKSSTFADILAVSIREGGAGCWFCPMFKAAFKVINNVTTRLYHGMQDVFLMLLALGGGLWIVWIVFQFEVTLHGANVGEFITSLFKALGKMLIAAWLLWTPPSFLFGIIVDPVVLIGTNLSSELMSASGMNVMKSFEVKYNCSGVCSSATLRTASSSPETFLCAPVSADDPMFCDDKNYSDNYNKNKKGNVSCQNKKAISPEIYNSFTCYLKTVSLTLIVGMAAGQAIALYGFDERDGILPFTVTALFIGFFISLCYFLYYIFVPLKFIDLLVRLGFVFILLPFFVVCWVFPATKQYAKRGWDMIISCLFTLLCLTVFIIIGLNLVEGVLR